MTRTRTSTVALTAASLLVAGALAGCSIGPVNLDDFFGTPSVCEARAERRATLAPVVTADALVTPDTLTVGILTSETAPLSITLSDGTQAGIDVDTAYALADHLGLGSVELVAVSNVSDALGTTCDVVMGVETLASSSGSVVGGYVQSATALFTKQGVTAPIDASELAGARVGVQGSSVSEGVMERYDTGASLTTYANLNEAFDALETGDVDFVVCDAYAGAYLATAYPGTVFAGTLEEPVAVGVAVSSGALQSAVRAALDQIETNGVGAIARSRWVGSLPTLTTETCVTGLVEAAPEEPATTDENGDTADDEPTADDVTTTTDDADGTSAE